MISKDVYDTLIKKDMRDPFAEPSILLLKRLRPTKLLNRPSKILPPKQGDVISKDVYDTVIKKDMRDPFTGEILTAKDVIFLQVCKFTGKGFQFQNFLAMKFTARML